MHKADDDQEAWVRESKLLRARLNMVSLLIMYLRVQNFCQRLHSIECLLDYFEFEFEHFNNQRHGIIVLIIREG